jgi:hypothetical protein
MDLQEIRSLGISSLVKTAEGWEDRSQQLFDKMVQMGWVDGAGRALDWYYWQSKRSRSAAAGRE